MGSIMVDEKYIELINKEIDGANSSAAQAELRTYLVDHEEAQQLLSDLQKLALMLDEVPEVDPPENLRSRILAASPGRQRNTKRRRNTRVPISRYFNWRPAWGYTLAGGFVLAILILVTVIFNKSILNLSDLTGSLVSRDSREGFRIAGQLAIDSKDVHGSILVRISKAALSVDIDLIAANSINFSIEFDSAAIGFAAFEPLTNFTGDLDVSAGNLKLTSAGAIKTTMIFDRKTSDAPPLTFKIYSNTLKTWLYEKKISPNAE